MMEMVVKKLVVSRMEWFTDSRADKRRSSQFYGQDDRMVGLEDSRAGET
jgi:hypothetical protein